MKRCIDCNKTIDRRSKRCNSCERKCGWGASSPNWRGGRPSCIGCGKTLGHYTSERCALCETKRRRGAVHQNWLGGISKFPYPFEFDNKLKLSIRERDGYQCQNCFMTEAEHLTVMGRKLTAHHIDYDKSNLKQENLIALCHRCNARANFNRSYWQEKFTRHIRLYNGAT